MQQLIEGYKSSAMLLEWLANRHDDEELRCTSALLESGVARTVRTGTCTSDMGSSVGTTAFTEAVTEAVADAIRSGEAA